MVGVSLSDLDAIINEVREKRSTAKNRLVEREVVDKVKEYERTIRDELAHEQRHEVKEYDKILEVLEQVRSKVKEM